MKSKWTGALLLSVVVVCVYAANVLATSPATTFVKSTFDEIDLKGHALTLRNVDDGKTLPDHWFASLKTHGRSDVYVVDNKFSPGATSGWHSHPGPEPDPRGQRDRHELHGRRPRLLAADLRRGHRIRRPGRRRCAHAPQRDGRPRGDDRGAVAADRRSEKDRRYGSRQLPRLDEKRGGRATGSPSVKPESRRRGRGARGRFSTRIFTGEPRLAAPRERRDLRHVEGEGPRSDSGRSTPGGNRGTNEETRNSRIG